MEAYTGFAEVYDTFMDNVPYEEWAEYVVGLLKKYGIEDGLVLDLGCGTGSLTELLARRGYRMTAVDLSPDMLAMADQKCQGLGVLFLCQDMSRLVLPSPADAVISCLDSMNYVTRPAALRRTFRRVYRALAPGGLFLFDVKTPAALAGADGQTYLDEDEDLFCVWRGDYSPKRRVCGYGLDLFVREADGSWSRAGEYHEEYAYTPEELDSFLREAGFSNIKVYGDKTMRAPTEGAQRVFFAAGKEL